MQGTVPPTAPGVNGRNAAAMAFVVLCCTWPRWGSLPKLAGPTLQDRSATAAGLTRPAAVRDGSGVLRIPAGLRTLRAQKAQKVDLQMRFVVLAYGAAERESRLAGLPVFAWPW